MQSSEDPLSSLAALPEFQVDRVRKAFIRLFGVEVRQRRVILGIGQEKLADLLQTNGVQISQSYISRLESGQRDDPSVSLIIALTMILDISLDSILLLARKDINNAENDTSIRS